MARRLLGLLPLFLLAADAAVADQAGTEFILRGASLNAGGIASAQGGAFGGGLSVGQAEALGFSGRLVDLTTSAPGFWPLVAGGLPSLDLDADGVPAFLNPDDDDDGLADGVETATGVFVTALDTGTDPLDPDTGRGGRHAPVDGEPPERGGP